MPQVTRHDIDALNAILTVTLPKEEYKSVADKEVTKYSQKVQMKGFRQGKTPKSLVKNMYGNAFLMDTVNDMIQKAVGEYLQENNLNLLGQPIPSASKESTRLNPNNLTDLEFHFDLGFSPQFDLKGLDKSTNIEMIELVVEDKLVDEELMNVRRQLGDRSTITENIAAGDLIKLTIKDKGVDSEFSILFNDLTDDAKAVFSSHKTGDLVLINPTQLENNRDEAFVRQYFLKVAPDTAIEETYEVLVSEVTRFIPMELGQAFFDKYFGEGKITSEADARVEIKKNVGQKYAAQTEALFFRDAQEMLMAQNDFALPDDFLIRFLTAQDEKNNREQVEAVYPEFSKNMRWTIVRNRISAQAGSEPTYNDVIEYYKTRLRSYLGGMGAGMDVENLVNSLAQNIGQDQKRWEELYEDYITDRVLGYVKTQVNIVAKPMSEAEIESTLATARMEAAIARGEVKEEVAEMV